MEKLRIPGHKVRVIHHGLHPVFFDASAPGWKPSNLPNGIRDYLFYPANSWHHKNHKTLLDALVQLKRRNGIEVPLVLTGELLDGDFNHVNIPEEIRRRGLERQVFHLGVVPLMAIKYLYRNARALVYPSFFEGFGLPLAEAMSCGCPIISSNRTSIPEIAGEAALYFDPDSARDISAKIEHFLTSPIDSQRRTQIGKELAKAFTARRQVKEHLAAFEAACGLAKQNRAVLSGTNLGGGLKQGVAQEV